MTSITPQKTTSTPFREWLIYFLQDFGNYLVFGPALTALLGSLYFSEIAKFEPCELCWIQRILMYPLVVIILVGVFGQDELLPRYVLPLSIPGMGVSTYHYLLQNNIVGGEQFCAVGVSCAVKYVNLFGFVTIPFMALTAFTLITILMFATNWANKQEFEDEEMV